MSDQNQDVDLRELEAELNKLEGGALSGNDVHRVIERVIEALRRAHFSNTQVFEQLTTLSATIAATREEIAGVRADAISGQHIPVATDQLDEVVVATEEATNKIMDCCDSLSALANEAPPETGAKIMDLVTRIYEACNFQDLTGQRITKVVRTLKHIETQISALIHAFRHMGFKFASGEERIEISKATDTEKHLLNGPQDKDAAIAQDDIDKLFG